MNDHPKPVRSAQEILQFATKENLQKVMADGRDPHTATAAFVFGVPDCQVTREMRGNGKGWNFGAMCSTDGAGLQRLMDRQARK